MKSGTLLFFLAILTSCRFDANQLEGNWQYCTEEGEYIEFYTKMDSFKLVTDRGLITDWTHYKIDSDTIYFIRPGEWSDSTKAALSYKRGKLLSMGFNDIKETEELRPLDYSLSDLIDNEQLLFEVKKRGVKAECKKQ